MRTVYLHLKPFDVQADEFVNALCGARDSGSMFYTSVENQAALDALRERNKTEPYPLCPGCVAAFEGKNL